MLQPIVLSFDGRELAKSRAEWRIDAVFGLWALSVLLAALLSPSPARSQGQPVRPSFGPPPNAEKFVAGRLLVRFRPGTSLQTKAAMHARLGNALRRRFQRVADLELVDLANGQDVAAAIRQYRNDANVLYAEPDYRVYPTNVTPNDPIFPLDWGLQNTGTQNGVAGADIHASSAWQLSTGSNSVVIGLIDTGIDYTHPDLVANLYHTAGCATPSAGDGGNDNGCYGINLVEGEPGGDPMDLEGHGTHVAGTIGAQGNNGVGVAGVNWNVSIVTCKFMNAQGGTVSGAIQCLDYMAGLKNQGANLIATNNSWGGGLYSQALHDAIEAQMQAGILFIAAAGNGDIYDNSSDNDVNTFYPASFDLPNIISVAATDRRDNLAWFSNYGRRSVHLGAPGVSVVSTFPGADYQEYSGTSMATPHVTGTAALLKAFDPQLDWIGVKNLILAGSDPNPNLSGTVTQKRLNAYGAMTCWNQTVQAREEPRNDLVTTAANNPVLLRELNINCANPGGSVQVSVQETGETVHLLDDGNAPDLAPNDGVYSAFWTPSAPGRYTLNFPGGDTVTVDVLVPYNISTAPSTYVSISGTNLELDDDQSKPIDLPFPIHFGGQTFQRIYAADNGIIAFDRGFNLSLGLPLPYFEADTLVAPYWDDLQPSFPGNNNVFWDIGGTAPARELVVEWRNMYHWPFAGLTSLVTAGTITFEVVFHEDRNEVDFNYGSFFPGAPWGNGVGTGEIGVQVSPNQGTAYSYNYSVGITSGTSLVWQPASPDFALSVDSSTLTALPGQQVKSPVS